MREKGKEKKDKLCSICPSSSGESVANMNGTLMTQILQVTADKIIQIIKIGITCPVSQIPVLFLLKRRFSMILSVFTLF